MYISKIFSPTQREMPQDAETTSHKLMLKAGLIRKTASGIYTYLPLALMAILKIENIIREEMNSHEAQEILMPIVLPKEPWEETGRWELYGEEMFKLKDRKGRDFCLGPTHEEIVTLIVKNDIHSYKDLPVNLYQIQNKYRDEIRPRFGLIRAREFIMKDAYSFDKDSESLEKSYNLMFEAYNNIFRRVGLKFKPIEADTGAIGGSASHEFTVEAKIGECTFVYCDNCGYSANVEAAKSKKEEKINSTNISEKELVYTPDVKTIKEVSRFLQTNPKQIAKSILYLVDSRYIFILLRGEDELNEIKLKNFLKAKDLRPATDEEIMAVCGAPAGFISPVGIDIEVYLDFNISTMNSLIVGANKKDHHFINILPERDFKVTNIYDFRLVKEDDLCPECGSKLKQSLGIEVGHTFKLGTKYSESLNAKFLDENGEEKYFVMGCYGIGIGRTLAAIIEQNNDEKGIIWPMSIAPFKVIVIPLNKSNETIYNASLEIYNLLKNEGIETIIDDREESAGVKFNDADLLGFSVQIVVGNTYLKEGKIEVSLRKNKKDKKVVEKNSLLDIVKTLIKENTII